MFWPFLYQIQKVFLIQLVTEKWTILWLANLEPFTNNYNQHCRLGYSCLSFPLSYIYLFAVSILCSSNLSFGRGRPKTWITQKATLIKVTCTHRFWNWWSVISNGTSKTYGTPPEWQCCLGPLRSLSLKNKDLSVVIHRLQSFQFRPILLCLVEVLGTYSDWSCRIKNYTREI
jgi:hypothetical protein